MGMISFSYLRKYVSISHVLANKGILYKMKQRKDQLFGPCPIHGGDNPHAFVVTISKNLWYCFTQCQSGGDVFDLVRLLDHKTKFQVLQYLATLTGSSLCPYSASNLSSKTVFRPFTKLLPLDHNTPFLKLKGITSNTARLFQVGAYLHSGFLANCIAVRLHDSFGKPIGYAGRRLDFDQSKNYGKWKFPPLFPKKHILYNFYRVRNDLNKGIVIVECPWAVMRLHQLNIPAVALLGTNLSQSQRKLLSKASRIIILLDGDSAGKTAAMKIAQALQSCTQLYLIPLSNNKDPDDFTDSFLCNIFLPFFSLTS